MSPRSSSLLVEGDHNMRDIDQPLPGDSLVSRRKSQSRPVHALRSSFFEDAFALKEVNPAEERVRSEAIVMAEVKTNVIVGDEFTFITELSYQLASRYQRPVSSIVVTLHHGECMVFGGSFEPAYIMTVHALSPQLQATTNRRNAAMIQKHMEEALGVVPSRGYLRFVPTGEDLTACNGKTVAGEIDDLERRLSALPAPEDDSTNPPKKTKRKMSISLSTSKASTQQTAPVVIPAAELTPPASAGETTPPMMSGTPTTEMPDHLQVVASDFAKTTRRKKLAASLFGRSTSKKGARPAVPGNAEE